MLEDDATARESVLQRALGLLTAFTDDDEALSAIELARRSGLPRSTAHRMLIELAALGLLDRRDEGYAIGTRLWELGELAPLSRRLRETALPYLLRLYEATGENIHLAVLSSEDPSEAEALYVARISGDRSVPTLSRMGGRHPLHTTGVGKALLLGREEEWLERFLRRPLVRETVYSIAEPAQLRAELADARERGFATTRQEMTLGNGSVAVAVPEMPGLPPTALGIVTHLSRAESTRLAPLLRRTAAEVAEALGG